MKKLVLLLENPRVEFHLSAILALLMLAASLPHNYLWVTLGIYVSFITLMFFYSYTYGFFSVRNLEPRTRVLNAIFFFLSIFITLVFINDLLLFFNTYKHFGTLNVSMTEIESIQPEFSNMLFLHIALSIILVVLKNLGKRSANKKSPLSG